MGTPCGSSCHGVPAWGGGLALTQPQPGPSMHTFLRYTAQVERTSGDGEVRSSCSRLVAQASGRAF